jgi:gas vesicle structural protein
MAVERVSGGSSLIDVLDRVLDKGIVIDAWVRISLVGIDLITVEARVVVASIDTYLKYADAVGLTGLVSRPTLGEGGEGGEGELVEVRPRAPRKQQTPRAPRRR